MKRFGVIGHPVGHSLSPLMHNMAYAAVGVDCAYESFDIAPERLAGSLLDFAKTEFCGLNVTIPHKERVVSHMDELSDDARAVGAVNTILFTPGRLRGENTDVFGVEASLKPFASSFDGKRVLVLGAGGTSRAITYALLTRFQPSEIVIANRNKSRADELVEYFLPYSKSIILRSSPADTAAMRRILSESSLIINATSVGMSPEKDASPVDEGARFSPEQVVFDLVYNPITTRLLSMAERGGARTISGLEMFLYQGARSFELWLGRTMPVDLIRPVIKKELNIREQHQFS